MICLNYAVDFSFFIEGRADKCQHGLGIIVPLNLEFVGVSGCMRTSKEDFCMLGQGRASGGRKLRKRGRGWLANCICEDGTFLPLLLTHREAFKPGDKKGLVLSLENYCL